MKLRFAITYIDKNNLRILARRNVGANHFDKLEAACKYLKAILTENKREDFNQIFGPQAFDSFEVTPVLCYDSGDCVGTVVNGLDKQLKSAAYHYRLTLDSSMLG